jgi:hypothetical protein
MARHSLRLSTQELRDSQPRGFTLVEIWPDHVSISDGVLKANDGVDDKSFVISKTL